MAASSTTLPMNTSESVRELSSARARISALEHALEMERCRSRGHPDGAPPESRMLNDDINVASDPDVLVTSDKDSILGYYIDPRQDVGDSRPTHSSETALQGDQEIVRQQLRQALAERDHARKLVQQFRKVFEDAEGRIL